MGRITGDEICADLKRSALYERAGQYEARQRGADRVEFEDLLMVLLVEGTDVYDLVVARGLDPTAIRAEVDGLRSRKDRHVMFPPVRSGALHFLPLLAKKHSDLLLLAEEFEISDNDGRTSLSPGLAVLVAHGISREAVEERLKELGVRE